MPCPAVCVVIVWWYMVCVSVYTYVRTCVRSAPHSVDRMGNSLVILHRTQFTLIHTKIRDVLKSYFIFLGNEGVWGNPRSTLKSTPFHII